MPTFDEHIKQVQKNLTFLEKINKLPHTDCLDWQVTVAFYAGLHAVNGHLAQLGMSYRKHTDVLDAINPKNATNLANRTLPEPVYTAYQKLYIESRKARYLINPEVRSDTSAVFIKEKHLCKCIKHLDVILCHFEQQYELANTVQYKVLLKNDTYTGLKYFSMT